MMAQSESLGVQTCRQPRRDAVVVHPHAAQLTSQARLEKLSGAGGQRSTGTESATQSGSNHVGARVAFGLKTHRNGPLFFLFVWRGFCAGVAFTLYAFDWHAHHPLSDLIGFALVGIVGLTDG